MGRSKRAVLGIICAGLAVLACSLGARAEIKPLATGAIMPEFTLKDQDDREHTSASCSGKITVLVFTSVDCPFARGVQTDLNGLVEAYGGRGVIFLGVASNKGTTVEDVRKFIGDTGLKHPVLMDPGNVYADRAGASRTPECYVFAGNGKLAYRGAFDNRKIPEKTGETGYVKNALEDLLGGRPVRTPEVEAWGCLIKR